MSIKLEWDVSEAPHDDELGELPRSNPVDSPSPQDHTAQINGSSAGQPSLAAHNGRRRGLGLLAGLGILVALAGGGLWYYTTAGWQRVSNQVLAAVTYEDQQASQGATNSLLNVQDRGNLDWVTVRRDEGQARQPAPL